MDLLVAIIVVLVILWLLGYSIGLGSLVHLLLVIVLIVIVVRLLQGRKIF